MMNKLTSISKTELNPILKEKIEKVSKEFESVLVQLRFKEMNKSLDGSYYGSGTGSHIYQSMFENNMVEHFVDSKNFGLRDNIESYILNKLPNGNLAKIDYEDYVKEASDIYEIPEEIIHSVILAESNGNYKAVSNKGAKGLMQLMDNTAKEMGVEDSFSPRQNIMGGTKYLRQLLDRFNQNLDKALAAYNAGASNVEKYNGIPPFEETKNYVSKILKSLDSGGKDEFRY
jgi:Rod binding domain-containing protein